MYASIFRLYFSDNYNLDPFMIYNLPTLYTLDIYLNLQGSSLVVGKRKNINEQHGLRTQFQDTRNSTLQLEGGINSYP